MQNIYPLVQNADGLIFASPTYNYNITTEMKAFIDRMFCFYDFTNKNGWDSRLRKKQKSLIIGLCAGKEKEDMGFTIEAMERPLNALRVQVYKSITYYDTLHKPVQNNIEFLQEITQVTEEFISIL